MNSYAPTFKKTEYDGKGNREKILAYVVSHDGQMLDQTDMANELDISRTNLINHLNALKRAGRIRVERIGVKRRYHIGESSAQYDAYYPAVSALAQEYMRENKDINLLGFLEYLEKRSL